MARYDFTKLRKDLKITQKELADKLGLSQGFLSSVENGRNPFPDERVDDLQSAFPDVNLEEYEIAETDIKTSNIGSHNTASSININEGETVKMLLECLAKANVNIGTARQEEGTEANEWRARFDKVTAELEKVREEKEKYQKLYYDLLVENTKIKETLKRNNIEYGE